MSGPKTSQHLVPATLVVAVVLIVAVVFVVYREPAPDHPAPWGGAAGVVAPPVAMSDDGQVAPALIVVVPLAAGADLPAAVASGAVVAVSSPVGQTPVAAFADPTQLTALVARAPLVPGVILTPDNAAPAAQLLGAIRPAGTTVPCPTDWSGTVPDGRTLVFLVDAPVARGTTAAVAHQNGALRLASIPAPLAPPGALSAIADICDHVAVVDLAPRTVVVDGLFLRP